MENLKKQDLPPSHFDAVDELSEQEIQEAHRIADEKFEKEHDKDITLEKSVITVPGQKWALISFVGESCSQKTEKLGMKLWGCFDEIDDAKEHLKKLGRLEENRWFDIYILEMYNWVRIPPDPECIEDQEYHDEKLNEIISEHKKQKYRAKEIFDTRKEKLKNNPDVNQYNRNKNVLKELKNEAEEELETTTTNKEAVRQAMKEEFGEEPKQLPFFNVEQETDLPIKSDETTTASQLLKTLETDTSK